MIRVYGFLTAEMVMSVIAFAAYGLDKRRAKRGQWRFSEKRLLLLAACLGAPGAYAGMRIFRHKTRHRRFQRLVPLFLLVQAAVLTGLVYGAA